MTRAARATPWVSVLERLLVIVWIYLKRVHWR